VSLRIRRYGMNMYIQYSDTERSVRVTIDLRGGRIIVDETSNVNVIIETQETPVETELRLHKEKLYPSSKLTGEGKLLKSEVLKVLESRDAFNESNALSINEIVDIVQFEKDLYPTLSGIIEEQGTSHAKRILALIIAALRREGKIRKIEVKVNDKIISKYYIARR